MSESILIGAVGLSINFALAFLAFRMIVRLDEPLAGVEPIDQPQVVPSAAALESAGQA
jgi:hypothetical protein